MFVLVGIQISAEQLQQYVKCIDEILKEFSQPEFYQPPKFHVSLLWCLPISNAEPECYMETKKPRIIDLEKDLHDCITELNKEFKAALATGKVSNMP